MNNQNSEENLIQIFNLLKLHLTKPLNIEKSGNKYIIINNETIILKIFQNQNKQIELEFSEFKQKDFNQNNIEIINFIIKLLRNNNIKFFYNELKYKQINENHNLQINNNYKHTKDIQEKCNDANAYFYSMLNPKSLQYKKGILIYHNKNLIGILKLVPKKMFDNYFDAEIEQKTILSFKLPNNNVPLEEYMIYNTDKETYLKIKEKINIQNIYYKSIFSIIFKNKWIKINFTGKFPINKNNKRSLFFETSIDKEFIKKIEYTYNQNKNKTNFDTEINL
jgi:hypothetical protein